MAKIQPNDETPKKGLLGTSNKSAKAKADAAYQTIDGFEAAALCFHVPFLPGEGSPMAEIHRYVIRAHNTYERLRNATDFEQVWLNGILLPNEGIDALEELWEHLNEGHEAYDVWNDITSAEFSTRLPKFELVKVPFPFGQYVTFKDESVAFVEADIDYCCLMVDGEERTRCVVVRSMKSGGRTITHNSSANGHGVNNFFAIKSETLSLFDDTGCKKQYDCLVDAFARQDNPFTKSAGSNAGS